LRWPDAKYQYGRKKDDAPAPLAAAAIAAGAPRRKYSDRRDENRDEKRRAKIGHDSSAAAFGGSEVTVAASLCEARRWRV
jgi:hypothetical protein